MKNLNGKKVLMKKRIAKWHLETPEVYGALGGKVDDNYESDTLLHLVCCLGEPVYGRVMHEGTDCYMVAFKVGNIKAAYYINRKDFTVV